MAVAKDAKKPKEPSVRRTPATISHVRIKNFRGFKDLEVVFDHHHALIGENGVGKTSILEAIRLACSPAFVASRLSEQDFNSKDEGDIEIKVVFSNYFSCSVSDGQNKHRVPCNAVLLSARRREGPTPGKALCDPFVTEFCCLPVEYGDRNALDEGKLPEGVTKPKVVKAVVRYQDGEERGFALTTNNDTTYKIPDTELQDLNLRDAEGFPNVFMFDRDREQQTETGFKSVVSRVITELNWRFRKAIDKHGSKQHLRESWDAFYQVVIGAAGKRYSDDLVGPVLTMLRQVVGTSADGLELSLLSIEEPFKKAFFAVRDGTNQVDLDGMGSGISMLFALLLLEHVSRLSKQDCIFLIDEPEMHLHPQLQAYVGRHLRDGEFQTIVSTHSPYFVNLGAWRGNTRCTSSFVAPRKNGVGLVLDGKELRDHLDEIRQYKYDETLFTLSDAEMLFARYVVLVEGPVDKHGLPRAAKAMGFAWHDLTFVGCRGKPNIPRFVMLCRAYEIPTFVVFDLDEGTEGASTATARVMKYVGELPHFTFTKSFEDCFNIGSKGKHKASNTLIAIDGCKVQENVPDEVQRAVKAIEQWRAESGAS